MFGLTYEQVVQSYPGEYGVWQNVLMVLVSLFVLLVLLITLLIIVDYVRQRDFFFESSSNMDGMKRPSDKKEKRAFALKLSMMIMVGVVIIGVLVPIARSRIIWTNEMGRKEGVWKQNIEAYLTLQNPVNVAVRELKYGEGGVKALLAGDEDPHYITFTSNIERREGVQEPFIEAVWVPNFGDDTPPHWEQEKLIMPK